MVKVNKPWYTSKTKISGVLSALMLALPGVIEWLNTGNITSVVNGVVLGTTAILGIFGIRDAISKQ